MRISRPLLSAPPSRAVGLTKRGRVFEIHRSDTTLHPPLVDVAFSSMVSFSYLVLCVFWGLKTARCTVGGLWAEGSSRFLKIYQERLFLRDFVQDYYARLADSQPYSVMSSAVLASPTHFGQACSFASIYTPPALAQLS